MTLSTANKNSYQKRRATFREYATTMCAPQRAAATGVGSLYMFGDNDYTAWDALFSTYARPTQYYSKHATLSFGVGGSGSGVPFHTHGPVFAEVLYGAKRWFLKAPGPEPAFDPDGSSLRWLLDVYPGYAAREFRDPGDPAPILECVVRRGEFLYIPGWWHHATLNIGQTVFMSVFV